nr:rcc01693 family protein [Aliiruegeria haliotis]
MRLGMGQLGLLPEAFWRLTPVELMLLLGADTSAAPITRARLEELRGAYPDTERER